MNKREGSASAKGGAELLNQLGLKFLPEVNIPR